MYGFRHENPYDLFYEMADRENAFRSCIGPCMVFSLIIHVVHFMQMLFNQLCMEH